MIQDSLPLTCSKGCYSFETLSYCKLQMKAASPEGGMVNRRWKLTGASGSGLTTWTPSRMVERTTGSLLVRCQTSGLATVTTSISLGPAVSHDRQTFLVSGPFISLLAHWLLSASINTTACTFCHCVGNIFGRTPSFRSVCISLPLTTREPAGDASRDPVSTCRPSVP